MRGSHRRGGGGTLVTHKLGFKGGGGATSKSGGGIQYYPRQKKEGVRGVVLPRLPFGCERCVPPTGHAQFIIEWL